MSELARLTGQTAVGAGAGPSGWAGRQGWYWTAVVRVNRGQPGKKKTLPGGPLGGHGPMKGGISDGQTGRVIRCCHRLRLVPDVRATNPTVLRQPRWALGKVVCVRAEKETDGRRKKRLMRHGGVGARYLGVVSSRRLRFDVLASTHVCPRRRQSAQCAALLFAAPFGPASQQSAQVASTHFRLSVFFSSAMCDRRDPTYAHTMQNPCRGTRARGPVCARDDPWASNSTAAN